MNPGYFILGLLLAAHAAAHDFWLDADGLSPPANTAVTVFVRGGHYFPKSEIALADRLISQFSLESASSRAEIESRIEGKERVAALNLESASPYRVSLVIRRPQQDAPVAWASLMIIPSETSSDPSFYARQTGLEIIPRTQLERLQKGTPCAFAVLRDGAPIRAKFQIQAAEGGTAWLDAKEGEPALFTPRKSGRHLAIVNDQNQTATFVFEVLP